jgi:catechol 2,3-dioxygenase-like lactoylglutathione lyase family enzyme
MLATVPVTTILQVADGGTAVAFYRDTLGLDHVGRNEEGQEVFRLGGGGALALVPESETPPTGRTEISFEVDDVVGEVRDLESRGVSFHDYDFPGLRTVDHVATTGSMRSAWFSDPSGNVLCLHELLG